MKNLRKKIAAYSLLIAGLSTVLVFCNATMPMVIKKITDALMVKDYTDINQYFMEFVLLIILVLIAEFCNKISYKKYQKSLYLSLRKLLVRGILLKGKKVENPQELYSVYNNEIGMVVEDYYKLIPHIFFQVLSILWYMALLFKLHVGVAITILLSNIISLLLPYLFEGKLQRYRNESATGLRRLNLAFHDVVEGLSAIKSYLLEKRIEDGISEQSLRQQESDYAYGFQTAVLHCSVGLCQFATQFLIVFLIAKSIMAGKTTVGTFLAVFQLSDLLTYPIISVSEEIISVFSTRSIKKNLFEWMDDKDFAEVAIQKVEHIEFDKVSFAYSENKVIMKDFSFDFEFPKKYLIIGANGAGKSTLLKLLFGEMENYEGAIRINGKDIRQFPDLAKSIWFTWQNSYLFQADITQNITLFQPTDAARIEELLAKVNLEKELIENRNENLNEMSLTISGGEKQKIIVARALLQARSFIVFDEAISNVDRYSCDLIENLMLEEKNFGFIHIAHHFSEENKARYDAVIEFTGDDIKIVNR